MGMSGLSLGLVLSDSPLIPRSCSVTCSKLVFHEESTIFHEEFSSSHYRGKNFPRQGTGRKGIYPSTSIFFPFTLNFLRWEGPREEKRGIFPHLEISQLSWRFGFIQLLEERKKSRERLFPGSCEEQGLASPVRKNLFHFAASSRVKSQIKNHSLCFPHKFPSPPAP